VFFFARNAFVHHLVVRRVAPSTAGSAGWLLFLGLGFLSAAAVLAIVNASRYLTLGVTAPLVFVGLVTLVAAFFIGRR
jgi:drug/metabolite transporter (DMT)-like permease